MARSGFFLFTFALAGLALAACDKAPVPDMPSFEHDIKPLTLSRCVRCHGAGGTLNADPSATILNTAPVNGFFDHDEDPPNCTTPAGTVCRGLRAYAASGSADGGGAGPNHSQWVVFFPMMPPAPGAPLTDRERELLDRWNMNPQP